MTAKKKRKSTGRTLRPGELAKTGIAWGHFEKVTSTRSRLRTDVSRTYFALCHLIADEFDLQRAGKNGILVEPSAENFGHMLFLKHAASALRMAAERTLKSFRFDDVIRAERYSMEEWATAIRRNARSGELALRPDPVKTQAPATV